MRMVLKAGASLLLKGAGEGSRGGHILGHTRSGKPVYAHGNPHAHTAYSAADHGEAAALHRDKASWHQAQVNGMADHASERLLQRHPWKTGDRPISHQDILEDLGPRAAAFQQHARDRYHHESEANHHASMRQQKMTVSDRIKESDDRKADGPWVPASGGTETPFTARSGARLTYMHQPSSGRHAYYHHGDDRFLSDDEASQLTKGRLLKARGEGARGGHVIGHTKSGKPIYQREWHENVSNHLQRHAQFSAGDHRDAATAHDAEWAKLSSKPVPKAPKQRDARDVERGAFAEAADAHRRRARDMDESAAQTPQGEWEGRKARDVEAGDTFRHYDRDNQMVEKKVHKVEKHPLDSFVTLHHDKGSERAHGEQMLETKRRAATYGHGPGGRQSTAFNAAAPSGAQARLFKAHLIGPLTACPACA